MLTPMLAVHDAEAAIAFYCQAFGGVEDGPRYPYEGKIGHAQVRIGSDLLMLADEFPAHNASPKTLGGSAVILNLQVENVDAVAEGCVALGARMIEPPADHPYGRTCKLEDPFGYVWILGQWK